MPSQGATRVVTLGDDDWHSLAELTGMSLAPGQAKPEDGVLQVQTNGATIRPYSEDAPASGDGGIALGPGESYGYDKGRDPARFWVRNSAAGNNATIVYDPGVLDG